MKNRKEANKALYIKQRGASRMVLKRQCVPGNPFPNPIIKLVDGSLCVPRGVNPQVRRELTHRKGGKG